MVQPSRVGEGELASETVVSPLPSRREVYREPCQDEDGNRYSVPVYCPFPHRSVTEDALEDGSPVRFIDNCLFDIESSGRTLTRCP
ncbi:MAG: hypothetical protein C0458_09305 [Methylobacterium sp.]|nr:hypothetical protein [Methylobacterium sp.]